MRTKFLKIGMPIMVFMLAIVFAFASTSTIKAEDSALALVPGYIMQNGICQQVTICENSGGAPCLFSGTIVRTRINETQCGSQLFRPF